MAMVYIANSSSSSNNGPSPSPCDRNHVNKHQWLRSKASSKQFEECNMIYRSSCMSTSVLVQLGDLVGSAKACSY